MTDSIAAGKDFLAHAGVLGMKWGQRKSEDQIAADRKAKANKIETQTKPIQSEIKELRSINATRPSTQKAITKRIEKLTSEKNNILADAQKARDGKLTKNDKKLIAGAAIVGGVILAKFGRTGLESGAFRRLASKGATFIANKGKTSIAFKQSDDLAHAAMSIDDIMAKVVKPINPQFGKGIGTKMNCRRATMAYEMRRRGNDVMATRTTKAYGQNAVGLRNVLNPGKKAQPAGPYGAMGVLMKEQKKVVNPLTSATNLNKNFAAGARNSIPNVKEDPSSIFKSLAKEPNGSRGELGVMWGMGGGHSMAYEIVNNKPVIFDAQRNVKFESIDDFIKDYSKLIDKTFKIPKPINNLTKKYLDVDFDDFSFSSDMIPKDGVGVFSSAGYTRLDNVELNKDYLLRWIRNVD